MKLTPSQLPHHLTKSLAPIYLVSGDELLLVNETVALIHAAASKAGFTERVVLNPEPNSDWSKTLLTTTASLSLFAEKRFITLHLTDAKIKAQAGQLLAEYATKPMADTLLVVQMPKLDSKVSKSAWYQALDKVGVTIALWPITLEQLPEWISQRSHTAGLTLTRAAAQRLALLVEGNLLAAAQEIEKLALLYPGQSLDVAEIEQAVSDQAYFDIFNLVDYTLQGNHPHSLHILQTLASNATEPNLILWALTRELRLMCDIQQRLQQGHSLGTIFNTLRIWEKRQPWVRRFLQRTTLPQCWQLLVQSAKIDRIIKGLEQEQLWPALTTLVLKMAGPGL